MSTAEWPRPAEPLLRPRTKRRTAKRPAEPSTAADPPLANFLALEVEAIDAEKWPVSPVVWWQPALELTPPEASGLRNERTHKARVAGFLSADLAPVCPASGALAAPQAALPALRGIVPQSDLAPIGWDPRTHVGKGSE